MSDHTVCIPGDRSDRQWMSTLAYPPSLGLLGGILGDGGASLYGVISWALLLSGTWQGADVNNGNSMTTTCPSTCPFFVASSGTIDLDK
ncbi:hypothetical protein BO71DRAFT_180533 [Aspergillus ellipticus CBS 707.79]|uniref:Uncharacterized protein n=1 Tax=Aspergillus ellipticus CBS 707.79 TaxID=1448320 RepID=A0A319DG28_9EURO|nr:hypothetical protein BO71DRAFT_180533 [Aspergillus ellipticus CBS 707.79]